MFVYDTGPQAITSIIAFVTEEDLLLLAAAEVIYKYMDGNFMMAPAQFTQAYEYVHRVPFITIHVCVYALLQNMAREVYSELFDVIEGRITGLGINLQV